MAISRQLQEMFNWYVDNHRGNDFYAFATDIDVQLNARNLDMNSAKFVSTILNELELGQNNTNWKPFPENKDIVTFLETLPRRFIKDWWHVISRYAPQNKWEAFRKKMKAMSSAFIKKLPPEPIILVNENKKKDLIFSVHLGDLTSKLGITAEDLKLRYDDVYEAIENELGYTAIKAHVPEYISVVDWPNASTLEDAKYEFLVRSHVDPAIGNIENSLIVALSKLGIK